MIRFAALNGSYRHAALRASLAYRSGSLSSRGEEQLRSPRSTPSTLCGLHPSREETSFTLFAHPEVAPPGRKRLARGRSNRLAGNVWPADVPTVTPVLRTKVSATSTRMRRMEGSLTRSVLRYCTVQLSPSVRQLSKRAPPRGRGNMQPRCVGRPSPQHCKLLLCQDELC